MNKDDALAIVLEALTNLNEEFEPDDRIAVGPDTVMFGSDAVIDSLSLVSVIVDVEQEVSEKVGQAVSLTDDRAIAREDSPFQSPAALAKYITIITAEKS